MKKQISYWSGVVAIGIVLGFSIQFVKAWTEPTAPAPGGNLGAPINTGTLTQLKNGQLGSVGGGSWALGSVKVGNSTLNSYNNVWLYMADENSQNIFSRGLAGGYMYGYYKTISGNTSSDYNPSGANWNYTLQLEGQDTTSIGFHDAGASVSSIKYNNSGFVIGGNDGWGTKIAEFPGGVAVTGNGVWGIGGLRVGPDLVLNSANNGWMYLSDQNGGISNNRGIAFGNLWLTGTAYLRNIPNCSNGLATDAGGVVSCSANPPGGGYDRGGWYGTCSVNSYSGGGESGSVCTGTTYPAIANGKSTQTCTWNMWTGTQVCAINKSCTCSCEAGFTLAPISTFAQSGTASDGTNAGSSIGAYTCVKN